MTNGYLISERGDFWRLTCGGRLLPEQYHTREDAEAGAKAKKRCSPPDKPKQENTPITNPDGPRSNKDKYGY